MDIFYSFLCKQYDITAATHHYGCFVLPSLHFVGLFGFPRAVHKVSPAVCLIPRECSIKTTHLKNIVYKLWLCLH